MLYALSRHLAVASDVGEVAFAFQAQLRAQVVIGHQAAVAGLCLEAGSEAFPKAVKPQA